MKNKLIPIALALLIFLVAPLGVSSKAYTFPAKKGDKFTWKVTKAKNVEDTEVGDTLKIVIIEIKSYESNGNVYEYAIVDVYENGNLTMNNTEYVIPYDPAIAAMDWIFYFIYTDSEWLDGFVNAFKSMDYNAERDGTKVRVWQEFEGNKIEIVWSDGVLQYYYMYYKSEDMELEIKLQKTPWVLIGASIAIIIIAIIIVVAFVMKKKAPIGTS